MLALRRNHVKPQALAEKGPIGSRSTGPWSRLITSGRRPGEASRPCNPSWHDAPSYRVSQDPTICANSQRNKEAELLCRHCRADPRASCRSGRNVRSSAPVVSRWALYVAGHAKTGPTATGRAHSCARAGRTSLKPSSTPDWYASGSTRTPRRKGRHFARHSQRRTAGQNSPRRAPALHGLAAPSKLDGETGHRKYYALAAPFPSRLRSASPAQNWDKTDLNIDLIPHSSQADRVAVADRSGRSGNRKSSEDCGLCSGALGVPSSRPMPPNLDSPGEVDPRPPCGKPLRIIARPLQVGRHLAWGQLG